MLSPISSSDLNCFSQDYISAREKILAAYHSVSCEWEKQHSAFKHSLSGPAGEDLICDAFYIGHSRKPEQLLVLISATHGIEGFAGSAVQIDCLTQLDILLDQHKTLGVILIHAVNPWGFAWQRRYDHQGIDLNRNFVDFNSPLPGNHEFDNYRNRLSDPQFLNLEHIHQLWASSGEAEFTETLTRGQYQYDTDCFYGGNGPSWSRTVIEQITSMQQIAQAKQLAVIDVHSGLGPYGYGEVINDHLPETIGYRYAQTWYGKNAQSTILGDACSGIKTGLLDYHWHQVIGNRGCFVTLEFGTYSIKHFWVSLLVEQLYNNEIVNKGKSRDLCHLSVMDLKDFFYPGELSWQQQIVFRGRQICDLAVTGMMQ
ncbi:MAG: M14 family metallopeptidase [Gammaproteobacteria bacterium]|nr:M14 family metallopeptidase [Gammaproteobacteria bacterium]MCW9003846.1 M14 family metallopeptidase [Gammaproteobacteria bacterium]